MTSKQKKPDYERLRQEENQMVKGIFKFYEVPGGQMTFRYKKYKGDPVRKFELKDGEIYELPLGVAKHLNKNGCYPQHQNTLDADGNARQDIGKMISRFSFDSLEFHSTADLTPVGVPAER